VAAQPFGFSWQAIFLINVPIGLAAFVGGLLFLGDSRADHTQKLDLSGVVWLSVTLILLVYPLVEGRELQWPLWIVAMLICSPLSFLAFVQVERRVAERGGAPLVDMSLFRAPGFAIGVGMALVFYTLSAFYLTFSIYLQRGLHLSPLAAGLQTLPLGVGYFLASFASAPLMRWLGPRALTAGFVVQVLGFAAVILAVSGLWDGGCSAGLAVAGAGFGVVMPSVIKAVVGGVDPRHAGLASGVVMSTFQVGSALGVAVIGGVFFSTLGDGRDLAAYAQAFAKALSCNIALLAFGGLLSFWLPDERPRF
jgi:predicted MFS family arabinose efflux permease